MRTVCHAAAEDLIQVTGGPSPEQTLAIRKLEEAMFWANAAIAREITGIEEPQPITPDPDKTQA